MFFGFGGVGLGGCRGLLFRGFRVLGGFLLSFLGLGLGLEIEGREMGFILFG